MNLSRAVSLSIAIGLLFVLLPSVEGTSGTTGPSKSLPGVTRSFSIPVDLDFDPSGLSVEQFEGFAWVYHPEGSLSSTAGEPALPVFYLDYVVHPHATNLRFELQDTRTSFVPLGMPVMGVPEPATYTDPEWKAPFLPTETVNEPVCFLSDGYVRGVKIATLRFDPLLLASSDILLLHEEVHGHLTFDVELGRLYETRTLSLRETSVFKGMFETGLMNPEDLDRFGAARSMVPFTVLTPEDVQYVIITDKAKTGTAFSPLIDWKNQKGVPAKEVQTSMVYANYTGVDNAEKIRNFIKEAVSVWGTEFVLIGGDTGVVPVRKVYNSANGYSSSSDPTDLYYSDLDGTWNGDGDSTWGETTDGVDMRPDVIVGRAPVQSVAETNNFVAKTLKYEKEPPSGYLDNATLAGEYLDSITNSSRGLDNIKNNLLTSNYRSTSLYDRSNGVFGNLNKPNFMASVNKGASLIFHAGHSNWNVMSVGTASNGDLYNGDIKNYNGGYKLGVISSVGCIANKFDQDDCIGELHVMEPDGGTIAFIGNTNYGWYSPGSPGGGPSDVFQYRMAYELFKNGKNRVGTHFAEGKRYYAGSANSYNSDRWIEMVLNLIGDPEMFLRTAEPALPNLTLPDRIGIGTTEIDITVKDSSGNTVRGSLICLEQDGKFSYNQTDAQGQSHLVLPVSGRPYLNLTVTGQNFIPYITNISLDSILPSIVVNGPFSATTGDIFQVNCTLSDEYGISDAYMEHYTNTVSVNVSGSVQLQETDGFWTGDVMALSNSTAPLEFRIAARDGSGNWNRSGWFSLQVVDDDLPYLIQDLTGMRATTGDPHDLVMALADNIGISAVMLRTGWEGEEPLYTGPMTHLGSGVYSHTLNVPSGRDGVLVYEAFMTDLSGNTERTGGSTVTVVDDDRPVFLEDLSDTEGTTSDPVELRVRASDNIGIYEVRVDYWSPQKGFIGTGTMNLTGDGSYALTFMAPSDLIGTIEHRFNVVDMSGNSNASLTGSMRIEDDDPPIVISDQLPPSVMTGEPVAVKATVLDNVGVTSVDLVIIYGGLRTERVGMVLGSGNRYTAVVKVPESGSGDITVRVEAVDGSGNGNISLERSVSIQDKEPPRVVSIRSMSSVKAGGELEVSIEAEDNIGLEKGVITWYLSSDPYRTDVEMVLSGKVLQASFALDTTAYGYLYWTADITDTSGNHVTTRKMEVRIVRPDAQIDPDDDGQGPPRVPLEGEDLDRDDMDDLWEFRNGLDLDSDDSGEDPDGDGSTNLEEFIDGTAPRDALHYPADRIISGSGPDDRDISYIVMISGAALLLLLMFLAALLFFRRV